MTEPLAYRLMHEDKEYGHGYELEAAHTCGIAGLDCPNCGLWATIGVDYPSIDMSGAEPDIAGYIHQSSSRKMPTPLTLEEFNALAKKMKPILGPDRPLKPGTKFGPLVHGYGSGKFDDILWVAPWTVIMGQSLFEFARESGLDILGAAGQFRIRRKGQEPLIEIEAHPTARLHPETPIVRCDICGRITGGIERENIQLDLDKFDASIPIQRLYEWPGVFIVNEQFANFVRGRNLSGARLIPLIPGQRQPDTMNPIVREFFEWKDKQD